jgi:hypothetical protein
MTGGEPPSSWLKADILVMVQTPLCCLGKAVGAVFVKPLVGLRRIQTVWRHL